MEVSVLPTAPIARPKRTRTNPKKTSTMLQPAPPPPPHRSGEAPRDHAFIGDANSLADGVQCCCGPADQLSREGLKTDGTSRTTVSSVQAVDQGAAGIDGAIFCEQETLNCCPISLPCVLSSVPSFPGQSSCNRMVQPLMSS